MPPTAPAAPVEPVAPWEHQDEADRLLAAIRATVSSWQAAWSNLADDFRVLSARFAGERDMKMLRQEVELVQKVVDGRIRDGKASPRGFVLPTAA